MLKQPRTQLSGNYHATFQDLCLYRVHQWKRIGPLCDLEFPVHTSTNAKIQVTQISVNSENLGGTWSETPVFGCEILSGEYVFRSVSLDY